MPTLVLTINGGSSSIRFAVYEAGATPKPQIHGQIERIGLAGTSLQVSGAMLQEPLHQRVDASDHRDAAGLLLDWFESRPLFADLEVVGHRVVNGMTQTGPKLIDAELLRELKRMTPFDPEHLPREIELIEAIGRRFPQLPQAACFDTVFHRNMPRVAAMLPIPRRYEAKGLRRYGYHGLSYAFLMEELSRLKDPAATHGRVILAHLGNGASMAAVRDGRSIDTSMGFSPAAGLVMSTRTGDLDPGVFFYLASTEAMDAQRFQAMVNHESGLLGVSETSPDVRDLLARESTDVRAAEALALFCYEAKKRIGSFAAALGGLDTLVFAGGIGENAAPIRARICADLEFLGLALDDKANSANAGLISAASSRVKVRVIHTDEEVMIAKQALAVIGSASTGSETIRAS
jgi:acetate kinase